MGGDCFGDAVNVAARLLDHAGDNETLITDEVFGGLIKLEQQRFRSLDWMHLRGRAEPVHVHLLGGKRPAYDAAATAFGAVMAPMQEPEGIRLTWRRTRRLMTSDRLPMVMGRSAQSAFCVEDSRVSRQHARIDWQGGVFSLVDLSINGTFVRFAGSEEVLSLKRGTCTLHGSGVIGLGGSPADRQCGDGEVRSRSLRRHAAARHAGLNWLAGGRRCIADNPRPCPSRTSPLNPR